MPTVIVPWLLSCASRPPPPPPVSLFPQAASRPGAPIRPAASPALSRKSRLDQPCSRGTVRVVPDSRIRLLTPSGSGCTTYDNVRRRLASCAHEPDDEEGHANRHPLSGIRRRGRLRAA